MSDLPENVPKGHLRYCVVVTGEVEYPQGEWRLVIRGTPRAGSGLTCAAAMVPVEIDRYWQPDDGAVAYVADLSDLYENVEFGMMSLGSPEFIGLKAIAS